MKQKEHPYKVGEKYFIRTVTMALLGELDAVYEHELVLKDCSWVADTGRFADFLKEGNADEVEPFPAGEVIVGRGALVDCCVWAHGLLRNQK